MSNCHSSRLIAGLFFCILASSAWAIGIKHPSDYGSPPGINLFPCGVSQQIVDGVIATCFAGNGPSPDDFLFTLAGVSPGASILSTTFDFPEVVTGFGIVEGTSADPCSGMNVACLPDTTLVTINSLDSKTFTFSNFTPDLSGKVTAFFTVTDNVSGLNTPTFTTATTSGGTTATPEPSEIGLLAFALGSLIILRRKQKYG